MHFVISLLIVSILCSSQCVIECQDITEDLEILHLLNEIDRPSDDAYKTDDIFDMFGEKMVPVVNQDLNSEIDTAHWSSCSREKKVLKMLNEKLKSYLSERQELEEQIKSENLLNIGLQKKLMKQNFLDVRPFYDRLVHHFWTNVKGELPEEALTTKDGPLIRYLQVNLRLSDIKTFQDFSHSEVAYHDVDHFFQNNIVSYYIESEKSTVWNQLRKTASSVVNKYSSTEAWISLLWSVFIIIVVWFFWLFLRDIQRELKWGRVVALICVILFTLSCFYNYQHLLKLKGSKRQNFMSKHGGGNIPIECQRGDESWFQSLKSLYFGYDVTCEKYFEIVMTDASDEISPMAIVTETIALSLLSPLDLFGTHTGKFFANFYANIPWLYLIPATFILFSVIMVTIFSLFGYGVRIPFLGSIGPATQNSDVVKLKKIIQESERKMIENNKKMVEEAKQILLQISEVTLAKVREANNDSAPYPSLVKVSTVILERKLENMIGKRFNQIQGHSESSSRSSSPTRISRRSSSDLTNSRVEDEADCLLSDNYLAEIDQVLNHHDSSTFLENVKLIMES